MSEGPGYQEIINEAQLEQLAIQWFQDTGWSYEHGPDIAPEGAAPERSDFRFVILKDWLASAISRLNPKLLRERDLVLIDYDGPARNDYQVTEGWTFHNGHYGAREDVAFLISGIPMLVIEGKNANKDEAIAHHYFAYSRLYVK